MNEDNGREKYRNLKTGIVLPLFTVHEFRIKTMLINLKIMKKIFGLGILALTITACSNGIGANTSGEVKMVAKELKKQQDSLALDSFRRAEAIKKELAIQLKQEKESQTTTTPRSNGPSNQAHKASNQHSSSVSTSQTTNTNPKKGWSDAAKGTAIGAGVGAGMGLLIDKKKRGRGAAIGAVIGGGSGYAIGRKNDRKTGRVKK